MGFNDRRRQGLATVLARENIAADAALFNRRAPNTGAALPQGEMLHAVERKGTDGQMLRDRHAALQGRLIEDERLRRNDAWGRDQDLWRRNEDIDRTAREWARMALDERQNRWGRAKADREFGYQQDRDKISDARNLDSDRWNRYHQGQQLGLEGQRNQALADYYTSQGEIGRARLEGQEKPSISSAQIGTMMPEFERHAAAAGADAAAFEEKDEKGRARPNQRAAFAAAVQRIVFERGGQVAPADFPEIARQAAQAIGLIAGGGAPTLPPATQAPSAPHPPAAGQQYGLPPSAIPQGPSQPVPPHEATQRPALPPASQSALPPPPDLTWGRLVEEPREPRSGISFGQFTGQRQGQLTAGGYKLGAGEGTEEDMERWAINARQYGLSEPFIAQVHEQRRQSMQGQAGRNRLRYEAGLPKQMPQSQAPPSSGTTSQPKATPSARSLVENDEELNAAMQALEAADSPEAERAAIAAIKARQARLEQAEPVEAEPEPATSFSGDMVLDDAHRMRRRALEAGDAAGATEQQRRIDERTQRNKALGDDFRAWDEFTPELGTAGREPDQPSGDPLPRAGFDPDAFLGARGALPEGVGNDQYVQTRLNRAAGTQATPRTDGPVEAALGRALGPNAPRALPATPHGELRRQISDRRGRHNPAPALPQEPPQPTVSMAAPAPSTPPPPAEDDPRLAEDERLASYEPYLSDSEQKALAWARENPSHPRAPAVMSYLRRLAKMPMQSPEPEPGRVKQTALALADQAASWRDRNADLFEFLGEAIDPGYALGPGGMPAYRPRAL